MIRLAGVAFALTASSACATMRAPTDVPVQLVQGEQLKIWGVGAQLEAQTLVVTAQVSRTALPRGALNEHIHAEVIDGGGVLVATEDASIYPVTALRRGLSGARLSAALPGEAAAGRNTVQLRVVKGAPHD